MQYNEMPNSHQQRDLVLASNEFCFLQSKTNGIIKTYSGPITMTISAQESLVIFDAKTKQFKETNNFDTAKQLFVSAPENWYIVLKNPADDNNHPEEGKAVVAPHLEIGKKINISGPCSFSLYPGQMAKIVQGHRLRSNQYLFARVYDADAAQNSASTMVNAEGKTVTTSEKYFSGQLLVIKGTEVSFYIPPTGIEVIPIHNDPSEGYVRDAITLERLEYCILKDEDGNKTYTHGPKVVFPEPTETFVPNGKGNFIFRAIELSKISGIYVKVIAEYKDEKGKVHPVGEELFITGDDQMIYYPRPEHAIINYDNKILHHAIAIPKGEGRYIMNRLTGEIETKVGPLMYLPDPRTEVVVKRKLTAKQCKLWYPGNTEALLYNDALTEKSVEKSVAKSAQTSYLNAVNCSLTNSVTMDSFESNASISRGTSYTKPRTVTLDTKYDGVVSLDVWTGYAVNIVSKNGDRQVVCGPQTVLLDYDQTLDTLQLSTGRPKTTDNIIETVFLRHENNKVSDLIEVETKDFVTAKVKVSYCVDFLPKYKDKWFSIENYVKYMCDRQRSLMKREVKKYTIEEFYQNYSEIIRNIAINAPKPDEERAENECGRPGRFFSENGMLVHDVEVLSLHVESEIADLLTEHQCDMIQKSLELSSAEKMIAVTTKLSEAEKAKQKLRYDEILNRMELQRVEALKKMEIQAEVARKDEAEKEAAKNAERDLQAIIDEIHMSKLEREAAEREAEIEHKKALADIEKAKQEAYAKTVASIMESIGPDLVAAMNAKSNSEMTVAIAESLSPYALAGAGESASDVVNKLMRGLPLETVIADISKK